MVQGVDLRVGILSSSVPLFFNEACWCARAHALSGIDGFMPQNQNYQIENGE